MSEDPRPGSEGRKSLLETLATDKRVLGGVLGAAILIALLSTLGGSDDQDIGAGAGTTQPTQVPSATEEPTGLAIPPIDGCTLLDDDLMFDALGPSADSGMFSFASQEACRWQPGDESVEDVWVELAPADPGDFEQGATFHDVEGVGLRGVDDVALWFGGAGQGTLSAVRETEVGYLLMRLTVSRPDLGDQERQDLASRLLTKAMDFVQYGPPPAVEVNLCDLITDEEAEQLLAPHRESRAAARDTLFTTDNFGDLVDLTQPDDFNCAKLILTEIYVKVETTTQDDFAAGASIEGVTGEPVDGIGDAAMWFEDVPFQTSFSAPHQIDVVSVAWEDVRFRVVTSLPDLTAEEQYTTARSLAQKALSRVPGGPPDVIVVEQEQPDLSGLSFVDNLLAREADGEWTRSQGLIATLRLFAGELGEPDVLRTDELADYSGTGIITMAQEYVATVADGPDKTEITRLLDLLVPSLQGPPEVSKALTVSLVEVTGVITAQEEEEDDGGYAPPPDENDRGYAPPPDMEGDFDYPEIPPYPGECANQQPQADGWFPSGYEIADYGPWVGAVFFPVEGQEGGWNAETHLSWALQALTDSVAQYGAPPVCVRLIFSHHGGSYTFVEQRKNPLICGVFINTPMQTRDADKFKQQLAADIAHCYIPWVLPNQYEAIYTSIRWWNHAFAWYLSNLVYPPTNLEWQLSGAAALQETAVPLVQRGPGNWMFFQQVDNEVGGEGVALILQSLPGGDNPFLDELALADLPQMNEFYHHFSQVLSDAALVDITGEFVPYQPQKVTKQISGKGTHEAGVSPFQVVRWELAIDSGKYACITADHSDETLLSYRYGRVGREIAGEWTAFPEDEVSLSGDVVVIATTVDPGQAFSLDVRDVHDEEDCEDEEPEDPPEEEKQQEQCVCTPTDYFLGNFELADLVKRVFSGQG